MRIVLVAALASGLTWQSQAAMAQTAPQPPASPATQFDMRPIAVGLGAIAGVAVFNWLALGFEAMPGGLAYGAAATVPAEMSVAMSRVYATTSAVIGGWIAWYGYGQ